MPQAGNRLDRLRTSLGHAGLDGFLVTHPPNLRYLFGFTGSLGAALVTHNNCDLLVDSRYLEQAERETNDCRVHLAASPLGDDLRGLLTKPSRIGVEAGTLPYSQALTWHSWAGPWHIQPTREIVEELRAVKSPAEIDQIRAACRLARQALDDLLEDPPWEAPETEVAGRLEFLFRKLGAEGTAFDTIVASGPQSSLPHAQPGNRLVRPDQVLLIDFGARKNGYCSDMTRVILPDDDRVHRVADVVRNAQRAAIGEIRPGVSTLLVDRAARDLIADAGYAGRFGHGTGHGIGLEIHELPRISTSGESLLSAGMVVTVEPGIYLPGEFGIRIEDVAVVTETGCELLSA